FLDLGEGGIYGFAPGIVCSFFFIHVFLTIIDLIHIPKNPLAAQSGFRSLGGTSLSCVLRIVCLKNHVYVL
ncbi:hypothetical protein ACFLR7_07395, partial [Acidobacteriota bacterium]